MKTKTKTKKKGKKNETIKKKRNTDGEKRKQCRNESLVLDSYTHRDRRFQCCLMRCKKKEREKKRKERISDHFLEEEEIFFCFFQIVFAASPWKLAAAQVMVDRSAFVKISSTTNISHTRFWSWCMPP